jgi:hypothetical protein
MYFSKDDFIASSIIAIVILLVIILFNHLSTANNLKGYWGCISSGSIFKFDPVSWNSFEIRTNGDVKKGKCGLFNKIYLSDGSTGKITYRKRRIEWDDGTVWAIQGIR